MIDHEAHLKQIFENQKTLSTEIQELNNVLNVKREQFMKLQGIVEYLTSNGIKLEQPEQQEQVEKMNYTWQLTSLKRKDTPDLQNIVVQTYWKKTGTDENGNEGSFSGATPFDLSSVDPTRFTSYEDLTEEMVLGWIQSVVVGDYERHVNEKIVEQIEAIVSPVVSVTGGFPWQPEDEVTEGSSGPAATAESTVDVTQTPSV